MPRDQRGSCDPRLGARQEGFRERLLAADRVAATVTSPDRLERRCTPSLSCRGPARRGCLVGRVWNIPARARGFTGRAELLAGLREALLGGGPAALHALHGIGGVGKTTTAIECANRYREDYDIAWWVGAEDPDLIPDQLAGVARALDLVPAEAPAEVGMARLAGALPEREPWLLIFDNAEHPDALARFLIDGPGHTIITSRNPDWDGLANPLAVEELAGRSRWSCSPAGYLTCRRGWRIGLPRRWGTCPWRWIRRSGCCATLACRSPITLRC